MEKNARSRKVLTIMLAVIVLLLLLTFLLSLWLAGFVMTGTRQTYEEALEWQSAHYDTSFYQELEQTDYTVDSFDGYQLHVQLLKNSEPTNKYAILSHGYTDNRIGSLKYVPMYLDLGYNCVIYDLRGHGENAGTFTSYGIREGQDLAELVKDTRSRYPEISQLILHGESLGAATTLSSLQYKPDVDLAVADCSFSDIENVLREGYRNAHVPVFLVDLADLGSRIRYHYAIKDMRPIDVLADNTVPILFIHGEEDDLILPQNSVDNAAATKGYHEIYFIPGAGHAESILTQPELYAAYVRDFIAEVTEQDVPAS
jgi:hypothetical protein